MDHSMMDHPMDGGPAPEGIKEAADPTYPVGTDVTQWRSVFNKVHFTAR